MAWQNKYHPLSSTQKALFQGIVQEFLAVVLPTPAATFDLTLAWDRWDRTVMEAVKEFFYDLKFWFSWEMLAASRPISIRIYSRDRWRQQ